jgi:6-phosphofructokinase 1
MGSNAVIAQSGGPTAVINNSLRGAIDQLVASNKVGKIYGARMGILGVLREELIDISSQSPQQIALLERTPSAGTIGSCRYKIRNDGDLNRIVEVFKAHDIGYFFYCGGGDSMDTAHKIRNKASYTSDPVLVIGVMGRKIGFIPAAARLAPWVVSHLMGRADPERRMPLVIILPEALSKDDYAGNLEFITKRVNERIEEFGRCIVVIGEGVSVGDLGILRDSFGNAEFSAAEKTVEQVVTNYLNGMDRKDAQGRVQSRLAARGIARSERPGTRQRREIAYVSETDLKEAYQVGEYAVKLALAGEEGFMATIIREPGSPYRVRYDKVPLNTVANSEREFPKRWIAPNKVDVTDDFVNWALPLIGNELPRFTGFREILASRKCREYVPWVYRS